METSIVIPNYNGLKWLPDCLSSITNQEYDNYEIILVDNNSQDDSVAFVKSSYPQIDIIQLHANTGFAHAVNKGIQKSRGDFVLMLNTDTKMNRGFLNNLTTCMKDANERVGAVSPKMLQMDSPHLIDDIGNEFSWYGKASKGGRNESSEKHNQIVEIFSPSGGATLYRKSFLLECGYFDQRFFAYLEDVDLGLRGRLMGYRYLLCPSAEVLHKSHGSNMGYRRYISLTTCNRLFLFLKNIPAGMLFGNLGRILYGQVYFVIAHGKPLASLLGYVRFLRYLPSILKARWHIQRGRILENKEITRLLTDSKPEPSLSALLLGIFVPKQK